jgi:nitric oxide reductase activation protein
VGFGERPDAGMDRRAASISPGGYSRLGAAIRHGTVILRRDGAQLHQLLVVISDGIAYDHGYEAQYARADTQRALAELRSSGLACVCLSVGASADREAQAELFGGAQFLSAPTLAGQEPVLARLLERALKEVSRPPMRVGAPG